MFGSLPAPRVAARLQLIAFDYQRIGIRNQGKKHVRILDLRPSRADRSAAGE